MTTISSVTFTDSQQNPLITITAAGCGSTPGAPAASGTTGYDDGTALIIINPARSFSAGLSSGPINASINLATPRSTGSSTPNPARISTPPTRPRSDRSQ